MVEVAHEVEVGMADVADVMISTKTRINDMINVTNSELGKARGRLRSGKREKKGKQTKKKVRFEVKEVEAKKRKRYNGKIWEWEESKRIDPWGC